VIEGCEIRTIPTRRSVALPGPRGRPGRPGDGRWITPDERYSEKLATPDTSIADLIGEVDPIRWRRGKYLADELTIHYGLVRAPIAASSPSTSCPTLRNGSRSALLNLIEERDVQIRGFSCASRSMSTWWPAPTGGLTNRGRIITPLKDRFGAQIRTHYPRKRRRRVRIVEQERTAFQDRDLSVVSRIS